MKRIATSYLFIQDFDTRYAPAKWFELSDGAQNMWIDWNALPVDFEDISRDIYDEIHKVDFPSSSLGKNLYTALPHNCSIPREISGDNSIVLKLDPPGPKLRTISPLLPDFNLTKSPKSTMQACDQHKACNDLYEKMERRQNKQFKRAIRCLRTDIEREIREGADVARAVLFERLGSPGDSGDATFVANLLDDQQRQLRDRFARFQRDETKRPSGFGLVKEWTYTSPTGISLVGEGAVVTFAIESGLIGEKSSESGGEASVDEGLPANKSMTASQIDTSIALSANTIQAMFGSESGSQSDRPDQADHELVRLLSGAESNNSDNGNASKGASVDDYESVEDASDDRVAVAEDDVNIMADGEASDAYEAIDSSDSDNSDNSGDEVIERREYPDDSLEPDEDVGPMDDAFVEAIDGKLTLEDIDKNVPRQFSWSAPSSEFERDCEAYAHLSTDVATPTPEI
ncbi:hypothetical protein PInf_015284 [Phytophthora infestans]|nr:hypothetical protein PInf_015284 [Phytophthora infestans]